MRKIFLTVFLNCMSLIVAFAGNAENIYIAQNAAGGDTGASCANAHSISWLNASGNWGTGANQVSPGDTVRLCGTLSSPLTVQDNGSVGNPITILFEPGAKFSAATWSKSVITITNYSYIVIDGGTNGIIEATNNGSAKTYRNDFNGISINGSAGSEIKNLTFQNLYIHTKGNTDGGCNGIVVDYDNSNNSNGLSIHDNTFNWSAYGIKWTINSGGHDALIYNNTFRYINTGIIFGSKSGASTWNTASIYNNDFSDPGVWDDNTSANNFHHEAIHYWNYNNNVNSVTGVKIYGNYIHGDFGTTHTAGIFLEGTSLNIAVYNNVISGGIRSIYTKMNTSNHLVANNTLLGSGFSFDSITGCVVTFKNNIAWGTSGPGYNGNSGRGPLVTASNNLEGVDPKFVNAGGANYHLQPTSPAKDTGNSTGLTSYFTTDMDGYARDSLWDIGAYEYTEGGLTAPKGLKILGGGD